ncbi:BTAD domain-containing putative transcriptional regulator [Spongisporangium articulatum]|uniref:BTAD domain-containing putative transcriptional regulator n=1 Tax=Spongisporangium articulatum TaxID=3362603 RepID=A0ABW8ALG0_9ACTN
MRPAAGWTELGEQVAGARSRAGLSQHELALRAGLSVRALRNIERSRVTRPHPHTVARLSAVLDLQPISRADTGRLAARPEGQDPVGLGVLGPVVLTDHGRRRGLPSAALRAVTAILVLRRGNTVTVDDLVDHLWEQRPPRTCRALVQGHVARLRALLPEAAAVQLSGDGYLLDEAVPTDLAQWEERMAAAARALAGQDWFAATESLSAALQLWEGPVAADGGPAVRARAEVSALEHLRANAACDLADAALAAGRAGEVLHQVMAVHAVEPYDEPLAAALTRLLLGTGRRAQAHAVLERMRRRLDTELGLPLGPELRAAARGLAEEHEDDPEPRPGRAGEPTARVRAPAHRVIGRQRELEVLDAVAPGGSHPMRTVAVSGPPGIGKSALVLDWASRRRALFPDAQIYADLQTHAPHGTPVAAVDVLRLALIGLGLAPGRLPDSRAELSALWAHRVAGRRALLILDDVESYDQVRDLVPTGDSSLLLVVGRRQLLDLVAGAGAHPLLLGPLSQPAARQVVQERIGRVTAVERPALDRVVRAAGGTPALAHQVAAHAALSPGVPLTRLADRLLERDRLRADALGTELRDSVCASLRALSAPARALLRELGRGRPGTIPEGGARAWEELQRASLAVQVGDGRIVVPELVRLLA